MHWSHHHHHHNIQPNQSETCSILFVLISPYCASASVLASASASASTSAWVSASAAPPHIVKKHQPAASFPGPQLCLVKKNSVSLGFLQIEGWNIKQKVIGRGAAIGVPKILELPKLALSDARILGMPPFSEIGKPDALPKKYPGMVPSKDFHQTIAIKQLTSKQLT